jgi:hypothetical protein
LYHCWQTKKESKSNMKRRHDMNDMNINSIVAEFADKPATEEPKQATASPAPTAKVAHKPTQKPVHKPVEEVKQEKPIFEALKWAAVFGGLFALIAYWRYTGQMADSAAVPSLCAVAALFGYGIGGAK